MKNKKYYLIIVAVIVVLGIGFLVNGQFLQGSLKKRSVPPTPPAPTVDLKVDGSNGPVGISDLAEVVEISWTSQNATACNFQFDSALQPVNGSILVSGGRFINEESEEPEFNGWVIIWCPNSANAWATDAVQVVLEEEEN